MTGSGYFVFYFPRKWFYKLFPEVIFFLYSWPKVIMNWFISFPKWCFLYFWKWLFSWQEVVILFFYITGSHFKTFPEVFFSFIHDMKWLFVYLLIYFPKWFLLWQEVVILFFTFPEVILKSFSGSDFFSYIHDRKWVLIDLFISQSDVFYTSESDSFHDRKWLFCFFSFSEVILKTFSGSDFFLIFMTESDYFFYKN